MNVTTAAVWADPEYRMMRRLSIGFDCVFMVCVCAFIEDGNQERGELAPCEFDGFADKTGILLDSGL